MFAKISEIKAGDKVVTDADFSCMEEGAIKTVYSDKFGLYIKCEMGYHYLDSQSNGAEYVGLYAA